MMEIEKRVPFTVKEFESRLEKVRRRMADKEMDILLLHAPENIYYLSGYHTTGFYMFQMLVVPLVEEPFIITRLIERTNVDGFSWLKKSIAYNDEIEPVAFTVKQLHKRGLARGRIGMEKDGWFLSQARLKSFEKLLPEAELVDGSGIVEAERVVKSDEEIAVIRQSARLADVGMKIVTEHAKEGTTEKSIAARVYKCMIEHGNEYAGLPFFISSGDRTLLTHAIWSEKSLQQGENVFVELCGCVKRYAAPLFRTFSVGNPPNRLKEASDIALSMLDQVISAIRPGVTSHDVDSAAKAAVLDSDLKEGVKKRAGYSVGVNFPPDWGEGHFLDLKEGDETLLQPGMVFHVPQTFRMPGYPPVAFSETVLVTHDGYEVLTNFQRELVIL
jgi:Xaa-Pro dipeptidase